MSSQPYTVVQNPRGYDLCLAPEGQAPVSLDVIVIACDDLRQQWT